MTAWIGIIGTFVTRDRFLEGQELWFCLPRSAEIGQEILMYQTRKISGPNAGFFARAKISNIDPNRDSLCKKYGMSQGYLVWVDLDSFEALPRVVALEELRRDLGLRNLGVVRRNAQATYFAITKSDFKQIAEMAKSS